MGKVQLNTSHTLSERLSIIEKNIENIKKQYQTEVNLLKQELLEEIKSFEGFDCIFIRGWTPGFNDGDPCLHSDQYAISPSQIGELFLFDHKASEEDLEEEGLLFNQNLSDDEFKVVQFFTEKFLLEEVEDLYGTDYDVKFYLNELEPLGYSLDHDVYECGY